MIDRRGDPALGAAPELAPQSHPDDAASITRRDLEFPGTAGLEHIGVDHGLTNRSRFPFVPTPLPHAAKRRPEALRYLGEVWSLSVQLEVLWFLVRPHLDALFGEVGRGSEYLLGRR